MELKVYIFILKKVILSHEFSFYASIFPSYVRVPIIVLLYFEFPTVVWKIDIFYCDPHNVNSLHKLDISWGILVLDHIAFEKILPTNLAKRKLILIILL